MMENILWIIIGIVGGGFLVYLFINKKQGTGKENNVGLQLVLQQINELSRTVDNKIGDTSKQMNESLKFHSSESNKIIRDVTERLTRLDETNKQVISFTDQLENLQNILKNPKQRGILGEYYLETLLKNVMPPGSFEMQYKLGKNDDGEDLIPDAVIFVKDKIIPVDSKFSLDNYNRIVDERNTVERERLEKVFENDLKNRIVETSKYIHPKLGTMEFAFMFIPHEAIYYDLLIGRVGKGEDENLIQRAANKYKVIIVSPTSFLAYLQTVLQGLNAMKIEKDAVEIRKRVGELGTHLKSYEEYHNKLGNSLSTVVNQYNFSNKELKKIDKDVLRISGSSPEINILEVEKPKIED
jgi:DNA recombination protein RmuC